MRAHILQETLSPHQQAMALTAGLALVIYLGIAAAISLALGTLWLIAQVAVLTLQAVLECSHAVSTMYQSADPFTRLLLLAGLAYVIYRAARALRKRVHR